MANSVDAALVRFSAAKVLPEGAAKTLEKRRRSCERSGGWNLNWAKPRLVEGFATGSREGTCSGAS